MKTILFTRGLALYVCLIPLFSAGPVLAQAAAPYGPAGERAVLRLRKMEWDGNSARIRTPEYRTSETRGLARPKEWHCISVSYQTEPQWIAELVFQYYVLAMKTEEGRNLYSLYRARVTYADIAEGDHTSTVFLRPSTIERFGSPVAAAVQILYQEKVVAETNEARIRLPEKWWEDKRVVEKEGVTERDGRLLNRAQTPFALVDVDAYEVIK